MIETTIHQAKTHLSRLLREVQRGETVIILKGDTPVARIVALDATVQKRPRIGKATSTGVSWAQDAFRPLTRGELKEWGL
jgi:prevent-host-death family protein